MATKLAEGFLHTGVKAQALQFVNHALDIDSLYLNNYLLLASYYEAHGSREDMLLLAEKIDHVFQNDARGQMEAGVRFFNLGYRERAGQNLKRAYELDSLHVPILVNYGNYLGQVGEYEKAKELMTLAIELEPDNFIAHLGLAAVHLHLGNASKARAFLVTAESLKRTPQDHQKIMHLKQLLEEMK